MPGPRQAPGGDRLEEAVLVRQCMAAMFGFELGQLKGMVPVRAAETELSLSPLPCPVSRHYILGPCPPRATLSHSLHHHPLISHVGK